MDAPRARKRCDVDGCRPRLDEGLCGGTGGSTGGKNVVDQQDVFAGDCRRIRDLERAADIESPLSRSEAGLTFRRAQAHERAGRKG